MNRTARLSFLALPAALQRAGLPAAMLAGAASILAFAPFGFWPIQIATLALLFRMLLQAPSAKRAALIGWGYSFGWLAAGVHWLFVSMHRYGGLPSWMAALAVALLAAVLALHVALTMGIGHWIRQRLQASATISLLIVFPAMWMLGEWLRGWVLTGFPWVASGYAHTGSPLAGYAPLIGVYGLGWLSAITAGALLLLPAKKWPAAAAILLFAAGAGLKSIQWTSPYGKPLSVRLLQGNVPQDLKFDPEQIGATLQLYRDMIRAAPADLIATPETALPLLSRQLPADYLDSLTAFARRSGSRILVGIPVSDGPMQYTNSVLDFGASAAPSYRYDKHHLVPFGEFIPAGARWFVDMMRIPLGDFTRGAVLQAPFAVKDQQVLPNICYEDLFGEEIADQLAAGYFYGGPQATILLNASNIAWFGDTIALPQHLQISQMRSLETGRPMLRATNTGMTAYIEPNGTVAAQLPPFTQGVLSATVQGYSGRTPYILFGNALPLGLALLSLGAAWLAYRRKRRAPA